MRSLLKWTLAVQIVGWAFVSASAQLPQCPLRPNPGTVVLDQLSLSSQNGSLSLGLTVQNGADAFGYMHYCFDYMTSSGMVEAPTLRLNPGDTLTLDLTDQLNVNPLTINAKRPMPMMAHAADSSSQTYVDPCQSQVMDYNTTNVHFHGLNVPPVCHQDDVIDTLIQPGSPGFHFSIQIPTTEPPGLYWYHPHIHGFTEFQVNGGAAGAIVVEGMEKYRPEVLGLTGTTLGSRVR